MTAALAVAVALSLCVGARPLSLTEVWAGLTTADPDDPASIVLQALRLPRLMAGLIAGVSLGMAGVLMQGLTRNPLAEPGIMGINAGASFAVVFGAFAFGLGSTAMLSGLAFAGAALAAVAVFVLGGGMAGGGPVRMTLAGAAMSALLLSLVSALVLMRSEALDVYRFWVVGSLSDAASRPLGPMAAVAAAGALLALASGSALDALSLGDATARSLGVRVGLARAAVLAAVTALSGAAVMVAGPLVFLGLVVPHLARRLVGTQTRPMLAASALLGPMVLLCADVIGRITLPPGEVRAGVMTALMGGPAFVLLARRMRPGAVA